MRIQMSKLNTVLLPYPQPHEQQRISDFLERKCKKIDNTIEKQQQVIEKLIQYRMTLLTEVVTQGIRKRDDCKKSVSEILPYSMPLNVKLA